MTQVELLQKGPLEHGRVLRQRPSQALLLHLIHCLEGTQTVLPQRGRKEFKELTDTQKASALTSLEKVLLIPLAGKRRLHALQKKFQAICKWSNDSVTTILVLGLGVILKKEVCCIYIYICFTCRVPVKELEACTPPQSPRKAFDSKDYKKTLTHTPKQCTSVLTGVIFLHCEMVSVG